MLGFSKKKKDKEIKTDFFEHIGSKIKTKNSKRTISNSTNKYQTCYGSLIANCKRPNGTFKWRIKINKIGSQICIGIESSNTMSSLESSFHHNKATHYAYKNNGDIFYNTDIAQEMPARFKDNDLVIVILKTKEKTIEFYRNDTIVQKCSDINPEKYRLAVFLWGNKSKTSSVTIENCIISNIPKQEEEKKENKNGVNVQRLLSNDDTVAQLLDTIERQKKEILQLQQVYIIQIASDFGDCF